jgi:hypothetical protein
MNTSVNKSFAKKVTFNNENMIVELTDGRTLIVPLAYFPRLLKADEHKRNNYTISGGGIGLHWDELDEDISVENLLLGIGDNTMQKPEKSHTA